MIERKTPKEAGREAPLTRVEKSIRITFYGNYQTKHFRPKREVYFLEVTVYQNQVDKALKVLKRQLTKEGLLKELKRRRFYEKPSVKKKRKQKEAKKKRRMGFRRRFS